MQQRFDDIFFTLLSPCELRFLSLSWKCQLFWLMGLLIFALLVVEFKIWLPFRVPIQLATRAVGTSAQSSSFSAAQLVHGLIDCGFITARALRL